MLGKLTLEGSPGNHLVLLEYVVIPSCNISGAWKKVNLLLLGWALYSQGSFYSPAW